MTSGISRRRLLRSCAAPLAAMAGRHIYGSQRAREKVGDALRIDGKRLRTQIEALSTFGRPVDGGFSAGVSRVAYSDADIAGRAYVMERMRDAGLSPRIDAAGNIFARRPGLTTNPPILFGSHIDSVPSGGNFDGDLGVLAAIEVVRTLDARRLTTSHPLEVVVWAHEEGGTFPNGLNGSRAAAGQVIDGELNQSWNGLLKKDGIRRIGGDPDRIDEARRPRGSFHCYLELHIEQGPTLERHGVPIGIVEGIVSIARYKATITGVANHAGTTAMADRQDALVAASHLVLAVRDVVTSQPGRQVGTVGHIEVSPNAANVIPGEATLSIELRDLSEGTLARLADTIKQRASVIARETRTTIEIGPVGGYPGATSDTAVQAVINRATDVLGLAYERLPSGAGHDAQMMATLGPMGMIFTPSIGGISHSPKERTSWEDCARGADALLQSVLAADTATF
jgi:beta-ureidopropionase / N-carbamoyl-L-amino-acid hydrolase